MNQLKDNIMLFAFPIYNGIADNPIYSEHEKYIDLQLQRRSFLPAETKIMILDYLKELYVEDSLGKLFLPNMEEGSSASVMREILVNRVCKFIGRKKLFFESELEETIEKKPRGRPRKGPYEKTLEDVWLVEPNLFKITMEFLGKTSPFIDGPFVIMKDKGWEWQKSPSRGWQQYIAAFFHLCLKSSLISDLSAPDLQQLIMNTFHVTPDVGPLKSLKSNSPNDKYLKPFVVFFKTNFTLPKL